MAAVKDDQLESYLIESFIKGYNSYSSSRATVLPEQIPLGAYNTEITDFGRAKKRLGYTKWSNEINPGHAVTGQAQFSNPKCLIAASGDKWYKVTQGASTALTGKTFSPDKPTRFHQAYDRMWGANNTDNLCYTTNASAVTEITTNGLIGDFPVGYNMRLYMTSAAYPDRVYYSNPAYYNPATQALSYSNVGTFNTSLAPSTPASNLNAGYFIINPGSGERVTGLFLKDSSLYVSTNRGLWKVDPIPQANADGSIAHSIVQVAYKGTLSGISLGIVDDDLWLKGIDNWYRRAEIANFNSPRTPRMGRDIRAEAESIAPSGQSKVVFGAYKDKVYYAYQTGSYNDRIVTYNINTRTWSPPRIGQNVSCFTDYEDTDDTHIFLAGSANPADSYIYQLENGKTDAGAPITTYFGTASVDCGLKGLLKRFGFIKVYYGNVFGTVEYEVYIDEKLVIKDRKKLGSPTSRPAGVGTQPVGTFVVGKEFFPGTRLAQAKQDGHFIIPCRYGQTAGERIEVRFRNAKTGEEIEIAAVQPYFIRGSIHERVS